MAHAAGLRLPPPAVTEKESAEKQQEKPAAVAVFSDHVPQQKPPTAVYEMIIRFDGYLRSRRHADWPACRQAGRQADRRAGARSSSWGLSRARDPADSACVVFPALLFSRGFSSARAAKPPKRPSTSMPDVLYTHTHTHSLWIPLSLFIFFFSFPLIHFTDVRLPADIIIVIIMAVGA